MYLQCLRVFVALIIQQAGKTQKYMSSYIHLCVNDTDLSSQFQINHIFGKKNNLKHNCVFIITSRQAEYFKNVLRLT